jgi:hypothetical protein|tara:strand:+ start:179 stop:403 length:225 start_codon:yes stop_codon:yes gene_type:complete
LTPNRSIDENGMINRLLPALLLLYSVSPVHAADAPGRIAWFGTLKQGLAVAEATKRPILLISAAPHCNGVSGIW